MSSSDNEKSPSIDSQKMMLNDVVNENENESNIKNIISIDDFENLSITDPSNDIQVIVKLPYYVIKELSDNLCRYYGFNSRLNIELRSLIIQYNDRFDIQHLTTSSLLFGSREPRRDVLLKLNKIVDSLDLGRTPTRSKKEIEKAIIYVLNNPDPRTINKYFKCIKGFVEKKIGRSLNDNSMFNLKGLQEVIFDKLNN